MYYYFKLKFGEKSNCTLTYHWHILCRYETILYIFFPTAFHIIQTYYMSYYIWREVNVKSYPSLDCTSYSGNPQLAVYNFVTMNMHTELSELELEE